MAAAAGDRPDRSAGNGVMETGGRPGVALPQSSTTALFDPLWRGAIAGRWRNGVRTRLQSNIPRPRNVRFAPKADIRIVADLFDHLVGKRERKPLCGRLAATRPGLDKQIFGAPKQVPVLG